MYVAWFFAAGAGLFSDGVMFVFQVHHWPNTDYQLGDMNRRAQEVVLDAWDDH